VILLKNLSVPKMEPEKHHQNTFTENKNRLYAILERNFSRDFDENIRAFRNGGSSAKSFLTSDLPLTSDF